MLGGTDNAPAHNPRATAKQQTIHLENTPGPVAAMVDPAIMIQVLENLISNAVKYSPAGGRVAVAPRSARR